MKAATVRKYLKRLADAEPLEPGCRLHGNLVPVMVEIHGEDVIWHTGRENLAGVEVDDDSLVLTSDVGGEMKTFVIPLSRIKYLHIKYGERE
jgi:hypothetical protein